VTVGRRALAGGWGAAILAAVVAGMVVNLVPPDADSYRQTAARAAQDALSAVTSVAETGRAVLEDRTFGTYDAVVLRDAREAVATSLDELTTEEVPEDARGIRDEVLPILTEAARAVADAGTAYDGDDDTAIRAGVDRLTTVGRLLREVVQRYE
jgi:hypothetical protein